jgi:hypothetical protein
MMCSGFLVLENFASKEECNALKDRMNDLVNSFDPKEVSFFSTTNQVWYRQNLGHIATADECFLSIVPLDIAINRDRMLMQQLPMSYCSQW